MIVLSKAGFLKKKQYYLDSIRRGAVFIYPTDTIYGIGCNAQDDDAVDRIRKLKQRDEKPFSIIAPGKAWIRENCILPEKFESEIEKLPGPFTFVLKIKNRAVFSSSVNQGMDTIGVRIPRHWLSKIFEELNIPIVTTSVNKSGHAPMASLEDADKDIINNVDFVIYEGPLRSRPSTLVIIGEDIQIRER